MWSFFSKKKNKKKEPEKELKEIKEHEVNGELYNHQLWLGRLSKRLDDIEEKQYANIKNKGNMSLIRGESAMFFGKYPLRSAALLGGTLGTFTGLYLTSTVSTLSPIQCFLVTAASTTTGALLFLLISALSIYLSTCFTEVDEYDFGAHHSHDYNIHMSGS